RHRPVKSVLWFIALSFPWPGLSIFLRSSVPAHQTTIHRGGHYAFRGPESAPLYDHRCCRIVESRRDSLDELDDIRRQVYRVSRGIRVCGVTAFGRQFQIEACRTGHHVLLPVADQTFLECRPRMEHDDFIDGNFESFKFTLDILCPSEYLFGRLEDENE